MEECNTSPNSKYEVMSARCFVTSDRALGICVTAVPIDSSRPVGPYITPNSVQCEVRPADHAIHVYCGLYPYTIGCGCFECYAKSPMTNVVCEYMQTESLTGTYRMPGINHHVPAFVNSYNTVCSSPNTHASDDNKCIF